MKKKTKKRVCDRSMETLNQRNKFKWTAHRTRERQPQRVTRNESVSGTRHSGTVMGYSQKKKITGQTAVSTKIESSMCLSMQRPSLSFYPTLFAPKPRFLYLIFSPLSLSLSNPSSYHTVLYAQSAITVAHNYPFHIYTRR
ncbi:hypothetical protein, unlikely [Trypanosoma brucei gambiense DAL972]|uniref:Uncharacterized protein n=1 Tax=Trypanosoma brucei gambiense (strain MHOM/CI/86/DAL972) TaxID=679716 RepID=C9ZL93_TRYB9|nr:hypothetical protein, unlikely [Trypanosoma brucei gambiense DAL972]CBH10102.1 hypothetical protein, unlikely [Trypanosoma brucei gambiense DAL972]|eukprot:XP_011772392.1 hypothetical protein, unlikely [Trypanosoma brucei gambiense DAL972]